MADTGHIVIDGFKAGDIKYVTLEGFNTNASGTTVNANLTTMGFGIHTAHLLILLGFDAHPTTSTSGAFYVFGDTVVS